MADYPHSENVFNDVVDNLGLVISQLQDGESQQTDNSNYEKVAYWDRIEKISQSLSHEVTIISMAFSKSPYPSPENVRKMLSKLETASLALVSNFYSLPKSQGLLLRDSFKKSTLDLITKVQTFVKSIQTGMASSPEMLQKTGVVWEHSDYFSNLPKDNKRAVIELMTWSLGLLLDALRELEEAEHLAEILRNFLNCLGGSHITCEDDMEWLNYLHKAIEHNMEKIHTLTNDK